jgi:hypothetical protein
MLKYTIIFYTKTATLHELIKMYSFLRCFNAIIRWTQDLEDCDKVLRIVSSYDISNKLQEAFKSLGIAAELMAVYYGDPEDSPVQK